MSRSASIERNTSETKIKLSIDLDGNGNGNIHTGIGFFDHMLNAFARHGFFDLDVEVEGDLYVDCHHTIEDVGIVLGEAIRQAVGDKKGIKRYGSFMLPMDETLMLCAIDLSGRPYFVMDCDFTVDRVGEFDTEMVREFFYAVSYGILSTRCAVRFAGTIRPATGSTAMLRDPTRTTVSAPSLKFGTPTHWVLTG